MTSVFFDIALPKLQRLASTGASVTTELACKCDIVIVRKGAKRIEIVYEPYGPPFCNVKTSDDFKRIEVAVEFRSAERMGRGEKTDAALSALKHDLHSYIDTLYPLLEHEFR